MSYAEIKPPTWVDRFGVWLSARRFQKYVKTIETKTVADLGCGFHAKLGLSLAKEAKSLFLVDVSLNPDLARNENVRILEGVLPHCLSQEKSEQFDVILLNSVLEHISQDELLLKEVHRLLLPGGMVLINVPSWRGKSWLEWSSFQLGLSPAEEMEDHKRYYDVKDLWPRLIVAGFRPSHVQCFSHKWGLNTFALCVKS